MSTNYIMQDYPVTNQEFELLRIKFEKLWHFVAWGLINQNTKASLPEDECDISQEICIATLKAASYYRRQQFIEASLEILSEFNIDVDKINILKENWKMRTRHGVNISRFGKPEEEELDQLLKKIPEPLRPRKDAPLKFDARFITYAKSIIWNMQRTLGKKVSKEKVFRNQVVSLSEYGGIF